MRSFSSAIIAALKSTADEERTFLIKFDFSSGPLFLTTGSRDILWLGQVYTATGGGLQVGAVEESGDLKGQGVDFVLSGVDQSLLSTLLTQNYRGREVKAWQALLDPNTGVIVDVIQLFGGLQLDSYLIEEKHARGQPITATIRTRGRHRLSTNEFRGIRSSEHGHQQYHANDTFYQHAPSLANKKLYWGTTAPLTIGTGRGGGGGDGDGEGEDDVTFE